MDTLRALRVLGLPPGATPEEIKGAWRDLARVWHPDRFAHDARLQQKASDNLTRINEAHEALHDYDPSKTPRLAARVRESVAIILGMGELGEPPRAHGAQGAQDPQDAPGARNPPRPMAPTGPIGLRRSLRILGLGVTRPTGEAGTRRSAGPPMALILAIALGLAAVAAIAWLAL